MAAEAQRHQVTPHNYTAALFETFCYLVWHEIYQFKSHNYLAALLQTEVIALLLADCVSPAAGLSQCGIESQSVQYALVRQSGDPAVDWPADVPTMQPAHNTCLGGT
jgi:hypothetical protein